MFNGYKIENNKVYLFINNNYEFASELDSNIKKKVDIINQCNYFLQEHNIYFKDKIYFISNGKTIGYIKNK